MMRNVIAIIVCLLATTGLYAQDRYFLSIQSADQQPFYVRIANTTYSSSSIGHVVVPSLGDSTYQVSLGFPLNKYPEQQYLISFNRKDLGYTLKNTDGQDWKLINWESGASLTAKQVPSSGGNAIWYGEKKKESAFTNLMAAVVNDSAVLYVASVKNIPAQQEVFAQANTPIAAEAVQTGTAAATKDSVLAVSGAATTINVADKAIDSTVSASIQNKDTATVVQVAQPVSPDTTAVVKNTIIAEPVKADTSSVASKVVDSAASVAASQVEAVSPKAVGTTSTESSGTPILVYTAPKPSIYKIQDFDYAKSRNMRYVDSTGGVRDTISVIIDFEADEIKPSAAPEKVVSVDTSSQKQETVTRAAQVPAAVATTPASQPVSGTSTTGNETATGATAKNKTEQTNNKEAVNTVATPVTATVPKDNPATAPATEPAETEKKKLVLINSDCANFATDNDIDKLRVKLMDMSDTDAKLAATRKLLKSKCIYTRQIRALSELFTNDEGRYKFFETCYPLTADTSEFRQLRNLLSEDAYIARFKTLVRMKD
ncbi:hypothetical protein HHL16_24240 [Pseudoflavitalea sp. G-6-1-2]|uniref:hypothetical protein n=1 Tax=Pseudoflavitalea sp. G-6-1-2 TaxID=2728841 RepID=UPI00146DBAE7|nr:hypothetical protein [Pseudoflavitalea sp. G-6-1-2]NML24012.1 hypothetical protein [Pseudoflavitalea sp. G-6-1-2]